MLGDLIFHTPLLNMLDVTPGSVNPMSLIFDPEKKIHLVIDAEVLTWDRAGLHPGINTKTISVSMADFKSVMLPKLGHEPTVIEIIGQTE